jgi:hypothetical protein
MMAHAICGSVTGGNDALVHAGAGEGNQAIRVQHVSWTSSILHVSGNTMRGVLTATLKEIKARGTQSHTQIS